MTPSWLPCEWPSPLDSLACAVIPVNEAGDRDSLLRYFLACLLEHTRVVHLDYRVPHLVGLLECHAQCHKGRF